MVDRKAKIADYWNNLNRRKKYKLEIESIEIEDGNFSNNQIIEVNSGLITLCGRNGAGKSSVLNSIYRSMKSLDEDLAYRSISSKINVKFRDSGSIVTYNGDGDEFENCYLLDPSSESLQVRNVIARDNTFFEDYVENGEESEILNEHIGYITRILSKQIKSVTVIEVDGKLKDSEILPFFKVYKKTHNYSTLQMGQGEHKVVYLVWKLLTSPKNSIILLEEPEAFLCSKSQEYLMDFIAYIAQKNFLHIIMSTHSDLVLKKQNIDSCSIVKPALDDKISLIKEKNKSLYLDALGLTPQKKGVFLVEDRFSAIVLQEIFSNYAPSYFSEYFIDILGGESHILEVAKHYCSKNIVQVAILDGDMVGKVKSTDYKFPIHFLPNLYNEAPEIEVIKFLEENVGSYAESIPRNSSECLDAINSVFDNYHDWFENLDLELNFGSKETLEKLAINLWLEANLDKVKTFIFAIDYFGKNLSGVLNASGGKFYIEMSDLNFKLSRQSEQKYNLERLIGRLVDCKLIYEGNELRMEIQY